MLYRESSKTARTIQRDAVSRGGKKRNESGCSTARITQRRRSQDRRTGTGMRWVKGSASPAWGRGSRLSEKRLELIKEGTVRSGGFREIRTKGKSQGFVQLVGDR